MCWDSFASSIYIGISSSWDGELADYAASKKELYSGIMLATTLNQSSVSSLPMLSALML